MGVTGVVGVVEVVGVVAVVGVVVVVGAVDACVCWSFTLFSGKMLSSKPPVDSAGGWVVACVAAVWLFLHAVSKPANKTSDNITASVLFIACPFC